MCGLAGLISFKGEPIDQTVLIRMGDAIRHRGPDGQGLFLKDGVGFIHRRLKVIDLETGQQPCYNEDGSVMALLNGEIYNYQELRQRLIGKGHKLQSKSDTEVLVHLYEETQDLSFLADLNGMFVFVIYDLKKQVTWIARDRTGEKPLFYFNENKKFGFASEIQALLEVPGFNGSVSDAAVSLYFKYGYIPAPYSIYESVFKLEPAHYLKITPSGVSKSRYWEHPMPQADDSLGFAKAFDEFEYLLNDAVKIRMIADVPLGAFLSGGIDSSAVVALMKDLTSHQVNTFTIGFGESSYDETNSSQAMAERLSTSHHMDRIEASFLGAVPEILERFGEPFADSSAIPTFYLCRAARQHITVALSGDGADEVLGGYNRYVAGQFGSAFLSGPKILRPKYILSQIAKLPETHAYYGSSPLKKIKLFSRFLAELVEDRDFVAPVVFDSTLGRNLLNKDVSSRNNPSSDPVLEAARYYNKLDLTSQMLWTDFVSYMPDDIHVKVDRMSMAHALEVRTPFMDHRLIEFLSRVPLKFKIRGFHTKILLRELLNKKLGSPYKKSKHGFVAPVAQWLCTSLKPQFLSLLASPASKRYLNQDYVHMLFKRHESGKVDLSSELWSVYAFLLWASTKRAMH